MKVKEKNDSGVELQLTPAERELVYNALRHYCAYGKDDKYIDEQIPNICEILNVLHLKSFDEVK
ncbi:MAG: hypothetical protein IKB08_00405 [Clostridia bacterium]|nr:hypothetical protein [Clostridia bacterium]